MPFEQRHPRIFEMLDQLSQGQTLTIVSDHEPRPLRIQLQSMLGRRIGWGQSNVGDGRWQIRLKKLDIDGFSMIEQTIRACDALGEGSPAALHDLAYYARRTAIKRQHCVVERGVRWPYVGIVDRGVVQAQFSSLSGHVAVLYDLLQGDFFGETALFDDGQTALRYSALTDDTAVVLIPKERIHAAMQSEPAIRSGIERAAAQHLRSMPERLVDLRALSAAGRIAAVLLPYAGPEPALSEALAPLPEMTQTELAFEAGSAKEVVNRALRELEGIRAIERRRGRLVKLDRNRLLWAMNFL